MTQQKQDLFWMPTEKLIEMQAEYNPQEHSELTDLPHISNSLLFSGWFAVIGINLKTNTIVGGHGRVLAANLMMKKPQEWFDEKFEEFCDGDPSWEEMSEEYKYRFTSSFWIQCPCIGGKVDLNTEQATNIRLNSIEFDGKANKDKVAAILAKLPVKQQQQASYDSIRAKVVIDIWKRKNKIEDEPEEIEPPKPKFLSNDITVYNDEGEKVDKEELEELEELPESWEIETSDGERRSAVELEEIEIEEPDVPEGGNNVRADKTVTPMLIPLAIVLPIALKKRWDTWKQTELSGAKTDQNALLQGHPAFRDMEKE